MSSEYIVALVLSLKGYKQDEDEFMIELMNLFKHGENHQVMT